MLIDNCQDCRRLGYDYYIDADGERVSECIGCQNHEPLIRSGSFSFVIRCKNCKYWRPLFGTDGYCDCDYMWRSLEGETTEVEYIRTDEDFYCGHAERQ